MVELEGAKVVACKLPYHNTTPRRAFELKASGNDPVSQFMGTVFAGRTSNVPALGKLAGTDFQ